ncbi:MAG: hypothetical protein JRN37_06635 [Nitrososphaerota archaeon]|jgi:hypothetical protein|nr:hypothetical protein [Nitrososphaerota archaeon]MDG7038813.1 hypothetical protein [Nitrososphaerota archaeon]
MSSFAHSPGVLEKNVHGSSDIIVSSKGVVNGLSDIPNDGSDFGPDTTLNATSPNQTGVPYTQTGGIMETVNYSSANGQKEIKLTEGVFNISTTISITSSHIHIKGEGNNIIMPLSSFSGNAYGDCIVIDVDKAGFLEDITIDGLSFDFANISAGSLIEGIHVKYTGGATTLEYYNIKLKNISGYNLPSYSTTYYNNNAVIYVTATNSTPVLSQGVIIEDFFAINCWIAIAFYGASGLIINNATILEGTNMGIATAPNSLDQSVNFGPTTLMNLSNLTIMNVENALPYGISAGLVISGSGWNINNVVVQGYGIGASLSNIEGGGICTLSNASLLINSGIGIKVTGSSDTYAFPIQLTNVASTNNGNGTGGGTGATGSGVYILNASPIFTSCSFITNKGYGIYKDNTASGYTPKIKIINTVFDESGLNGNGSGPIYIGTNQSADEVVFYSTNPRYLPAPTLSANPPVSGTVYQNTNPYDIRLKIPITYNPTSTAAATLATGISITSPPTTSTKVSIPAGLTAADGQILTYDLVIPAGWYFELIATNAVIGTAEVQAA